MKQFMMSNGVEADDIYAYLQTKFDNLPKEGVTRLVLVLEANEVAKLYMNVMPTLKEKHNVE